MTANSTSSTEASAQTNFQKSNLAKSAASTKLSSIHFATKPFLRNCFSDASIINTWDNRLVSECSRARLARTRRVYPKFAL